MKVIVGELMATERGCGRFYHASEALRGALCKKRRWWNATEIENVSLDFALTIYAVNNPNFST